MKWILIIGIVLVAYQNCSKVNFSNRGVASSNTSTSSAALTTPDTPGVPPDVPPTPNPPANSKSIIAVHDFGSSSPTSRCFISADKDAYCTGLGPSEPGVNSADSMRAYKVPGGLKFKQIDAGWVTTCGITLDDSAYCWGQNWVGQLGVADLVTHAEPVKVSGNLKFSQLAVGWFHTCGVTTTNDLYCWGTNILGQLGNDLNASSSIPTSDPRTANPTPLLVKGNRKYKQVIASSWYSTCAITTAGDVYCWGANIFGVNGNSNNLGITDLFYNTIISPTVTDPNPTQVVGLHNIKQLSSWWFGVCGISDSGQIFCWGGLGNYFSQGHILGYSATPLQVKYNDDTFIQMVKVSHYDCGLKANGDVKCWDPRQVEQGSTVTLLSLPGGYKFSQIATGLTYACGVTTDKRAFCWKQNSTATGMTMPQEISLQ